MLSFPLTRSSPLPNLQRRWSSCSQCLRVNAFFPFEKNPTTNAYQYLPLTYSRFAPKANENSHATLRSDGPSPYSSEEQQQQQHHQEEEEYRVLAAVRSRYNDIVIVDTAKARMLLLDSTHNVHSVLNKDGKKWTGSYWDEFASLPAIIPDGPIAILGLGGGTAAHLMLELWPSLQLEGWEIDEILIQKARDYFGLSDLEKSTKDGGVLHVCIGDALHSSGNDSRRYSGIIVDLFCEGKVLSQLQEITTWLELKDRLMPDGRLMVNCGGIDGECDIINGSIHKSVDSTWLENSTMKALANAFSGKFSWKRTPEAQGANYLALTGHLPDLTSWSAMVPAPLTTAVRQWRPCGPLQ